MTNPPSSAISHVSDTARWVAMYRAMESERPDAIFRDPYARTLAGPRGPAIAEGMSRGRMNASYPAVVIRTALLDELILRCIEQGADAVMNLASGLDTRPYRLSLPPSLKWFDVDLPDILTYKRAALAGEKPRCGIEHIPTDLTDASQRRALFARVGAVASRILVVSEGLLVYLTPEQVAALARDLATQASFRWWMFDITAPRIVEQLRKQWADHLRAAPMRFAPAEGTRFFEPLGWREVEFRSTFKESVRLKRTFRGSRFWNFMLRFYPKKRRDEVYRLAGVAVLERSI